MQSTLTSNQCDSGSNLLTCVCDGYIYIIYRITKRGFHIHTTHQSIIYKLLPIPIAVNFLSQIVSFIGQPIIVHFLLIVASVINRRVTVHFYESR